MLTLDETKLHLRVSHSEEDAHITALIEAAATNVADYLDTTLEGMSAAPMPAPVRAAILLRVGDLYENREAQSERPLLGNATYGQLLNPYRSMAL